MFNVLHSSKTDVEKNRTDYEEKKLNYISNE